MRRRCLLLAAGGAALLAVGPADSAGSPTGNAARRIAIVARKFAFSLKEIKIARDEMVTLEITSVDFVHGFSVPELNARVDVPPGKAMDLSLRVPRAGRYIFLCDNFCGEEHDKMSGVLVVSEAQQPA